MSTEEQPDESKHQRKETGMFLIVSIHPLPVNLLRADRILATHSSYLLLIWLFNLHVTQLVDGTEEPCDVTEVGFPL